MPDILDIATDKMNKTINVMKSEYNSLRAGRANPQALDRIMVDYYGSPTPINQMGNISVPEPRMLIIALWDTKMIPNVEKAIQKSDLGINPANDGKVIRDNLKATDLTAITLCREQELPILCFALDKLEEAVECENVGTLIDSRP